MFLFIFSFPPFFFFSVKYCFKVLEDRFTAIAAHASVLCVGEEAVAPSLTGCIGALTTADRTVWAPCRAKLVGDGNGSGVGGSGAGAGGPQSGSNNKNAEAVAAMDEALFVVCLDSVSGLSAEEMERNVLYGVEVGQTRRVVKVSRK